MKLKSFLAKPYAAIVHKKILKSIHTALEDQKNIFEKIIKQAQHTQFGKEHHFENIRSYEDYKNAVKIRDYEDFRPYIEEIKEGKENVLWKGKPLYFAKTSGTTSGVKYIPISKDSIDNHIDTARNALLCYMSVSGNTEFADGKMIFLSGAPTLERVGGIPTGRLSGIVNHHVPKYLRTNQLPSYETNCIEDWEEKLSKIIEETQSQDMTLISGIPPWVQMYFDWLIERNQGKKILDLFPNLQVIVHGGVNFEPYKQKLFDTLGKKIDTVETYPASEGFFAFQDTLDKEGLLLNTNSGIFFEFVPAAEIFDENPMRLSLKDVELDVNYALVINTNAGLWSYNIGDTVKFVSLNPYRIVVTGRTKHFISAFGEHVIGEEVEQAMMSVAEKENVRIVEFTVAPMVNAQDELPYHEWFVEFENMPTDLESFALQVDHQLREKNVYYNDLIKGAILQPLKIRPLQARAFQDYMKSIGRLGGQNKTPRLSNDRKIADQLQQYLK